jgi:hypothetical protein
MGAIPGFILKRLYVSESLRNTAKGFEFALRNFIGTGTVLEIISLAVPAAGNPGNGDKDWAKRAAGRAASANARTRGR